MDNSIFKKLRVKPEYTAYIINPPIDYPFDDTIYFNANKEADFVHLFISSKQEFEDYINEVLGKRKSKGLFWISYPKESNKQKYDINRDILWDIAIPKGIHPVSQVVLDDTWSAVRFVDNEPNVVYERPKKIKYL